MANKNALMNMKCPGCGSDGPYKNALMNMKCPGCGSDGPFEITTTARAVVADTGVTDVFDFEWDEDSDIYCKACPARGTVTQFTVAPTIMVETCK